ncbi:MAG: CRISPR-associated endonuclease Cas1 [Desulfobacterales bacterium]
MPEKYQFSGRSRRPAKDPFNAVLNYCYGMLYSRVEKACILSGLDPFVGFLHTDNYNKKCQTQTHHPARSTQNGQYHAR